MPKTQVKLVKKPPRNVAQRTFNNSRGGLKDALNEGISSRDKVTAPWSADDKPKFVPVVELLVTVIYIQIKVVAPPAPSASVSVWRLLNDGTDVMRVHMTDPFMRKTSPYQFTSVAGVGGLAYVDTSLSYPGITKGFWDELANDAMKPTIERILADGISRS